MAKPTGFLDHERAQIPKRPVAERIRDYDEIEQLLELDSLEIQAARCMDCGVPSCHAYGCPLSNQIPDWNDLVYKKQWRLALAQLHATNNFPEITGRICPAPCESACTLTIHKKPVAIRQIELQIVERGWREGWIKPETAPIKTGKKVSVIGSGPAGLAAAQNLGRLGHRVTVYEKSDRIGGILRYGIPDYKLPKRIIDRRLEQMMAEGVRFLPGTDVGTDVAVEELRQESDALLICAGAGVPRDLNIPGRELKGVHFALEFLTQQNRVLAGDDIPTAERIDASGRQVVVVGGGDTGSDCIGTSIRQGARHVTQVELLPQPPQDVNPETPWPCWPAILRNSTSQEEGCDRMWSISTQKLQGNAQGRVQAVKAIRLDWTRDNNPRWISREIPGSEFELQADLVLLAMGFMHVNPAPWIAPMGLERDPRGNLKVNSDFSTSLPGVFAAGDAETGASLVVRAIQRGRMAAAAVDVYLKK